MTQGDQLILTWLVPVVVGTVVGGVIGHYQTPDDRAYGQKVGGGLGFVAGVVTGVVINEMMPTPTDVLGP